jgi:hypothetical protein
MANELGIDWRRFPHNVPKLPIGGFMTVARKALGSFKLPENETRWRIVEKKLRRAWDRWIEENCIRTNCPEFRHWQCDRAYENPNFWGIAKALDAQQQDGNKLLSQIDAVPRGKAVKVANEALTRIGIATKTTSLRTKRG